MKNVSIKRYEPKQKDDLIDFLSLGLNWKDLSHKDRKEMFEWRYEKNPYIDKPLNFLAMHDGTIVGHRGFVVQRFSAGDGSHLMVTPCDSLVHPDHRKRGIFSKLVDGSNKGVSEIPSLSMFLSLSPTETTVKVTKEYGFHPIGRKKKLYRFSLFSMLGTEIDHQMINEEGSTRTVISKNVEVEDIVDLMSRHSDDGKITNHRDEDFYRWRFGEYPGDIVYLYCWEGEELVGYLSLEKDPISIFGKKIDYYSILEYGYKGIIHLDQIVKTMLSGIRRAPIMYYSFTRDLEETSVFKKHGFKGDESLLVRFLQNRYILDREGLPGLLLKPTVADAKPRDYFLDGLDTRYPDNWSLFWSDVH